MHIYTSDVLYAAMYDILRAGGRAGAGTTSWWWQVATVAGAVSVLAVVAADRDWMHAYSHLHNSVCQGNAIEAYFLNNGQIVECGLRDLLMQQ